MRAARFKVPIAASSVRSCTGLRGTGFARTRGSALPAFYSPAAEPGGGEDPRPMHTTPRRASVAACAVSLMAVLLGGYQA